MTSVRASEITDNLTVCSIACSGRQQQRKHRRLFVWGIIRLPVDFQDKRLSMHSFNNFFVVNLDNPLNIQSSMKWNVLTLIWRHPNANQNYRTPCHTQENRWFTSTTKQNCIEFNRIYIILSALQKIQFTSKTHIHPWLAGYTAVQGTASAPGAPFTNTG